jgi:hypothetical protein
MRQSNLHEFFVAHYNLLFLAVFHNYHLLWNHLSFKTGELSIVDIVLPDEFANQIKFFE